MLFPLSLRYCFFIEFLIHWVFFLPKNDLARCKILFEAFGCRYYACNKTHFRAADSPFKLALATVMLNGECHAEAGARKLYAMLARIQAGRKKSVGRGKVAVNSRMDKHLPA